MDLGRLQHWLQHRIVGDAAPPPELPPVGEPDIRGSAAFPARQRLAVYAQSYALRLIECLREEFPVLRLLVGDQVFDLFAGAYIAAQPSRSYSLYGLGAGFADFLEATRPAGTGPASLEAIPASLARLERAMAEAQRAVGTEALPGGDLPIETLLQLVAGSAAASARHGAAIAPRIRLCRCPRRRGPGRAPRSAACP